MVWGSTKHPSLEVRAAALTGRNAQGKVMSPNMSAPFLDFVARRLQALAEPNRIRILKMLEGGEATVQDLTDELATTHQNVSRHLAVLYQSGMVGRRKDGRVVWYSLADFTALRLVEQAAQSAS